METPIAEYREQRIEGKRRFLLFCDHIRIEGKVYLKSEFELRIPLDQVISEPNDVRMISPTFKGGIWLLIHSIALFTFLAGSPLAAPLKPLTTFLLVLAAAGLIMAIVARTPVKYKTFQNYSGQAAFDIALSKGSEHEFESFVTAVQHQIQNLAYRQ